MTDRPILFSAPMVRALLGGRKTQTRRLLKPQPNQMNGGSPLYDGYGSYSTERGWKRLPFAKGDRLWVRETWAERLEGEAAMYRADAELPIVWRPAIHMPRWASRLTLAVTDVRVQRLHQISPADAIAEGIPPAANSQTIDCDTPNPVDAYRALWDSLNAKRAPWVSNPWIVAVTFTVERLNIDAEAQSA